MADEEIQGGENEIPKKVEPIIPIEKKIFLNDMNSWFSNFVIENLRTDQIKDAKIKYEFMGTRQKSKRLLPRLFTPKEIKIDYNLNYQCPVFDNDIFIYNLDGSDFNEIDYIIKGLKALKYDKEKILVIVSSIMTWARTPPKYKKEEGEQEEEEDKQDENKKDEEDNEKEQESEDEEYIPEEEQNEEQKDDEPKNDEQEQDDIKEPKKILYYKEKDFIKRIPHKQFYHYKMIETLALANTNPMLKTYIVCSGFIYGCGENLFYDYFKMSWLQQPSKLPIIDKGKNTIPTIHIKDLVNLIRRVIEQKPKNKYILAIDHTKNRQLKNIITSISKGVGTGLIENIDNKDNIPHYDELSIDIKIKPTKLFLDEKKDDEEDEEFEKRTFKWHCEYGIPENIVKLRNEFNEYRGLKCVKILITGPPGSGKTYISKILSKFYNIPHFNVTEIINWGKTLNDELGEEIRTKLEEIDNIVKEAEDTYNKRPNKKITDLPFDPSKINKIPDDILIKVIRRKLMMNVCLNRGYILDGYPRGYKNSYNLFYEDTDETKTPDDPTKYNLLKDILPNTVIRIDNCSDEFIINRLKQLPDIKGDPTIIKRRLERRLKAYKELNKSEKGELSFSDFFKENGLEILSLDGTMNEGDIIEKCKVFIERNGKILNYQIFDEEYEKEEKKKIDKVIKDVNIRIDKEFKEDEFYDNEKEEVRKNYNKEKITELEKHEKELLEKKSEVLRRYLAENVIPVLSKGILHVCQTLPDDPVDELAFYLFDNAFNAKFPPHKYKDQQ